MKLKRSIAVPGFALFAAALCLAASAHAAERVPAERGSAERGLWITCIGERNVLGSRSAVTEAVAFAKRGGFKKLFVQVYRGDQAWFDSKLADAAPFRRNKAAAGADSFKLLMDLAAKEGIEVHAWVNALTLSQNRSAPILAKHGPGVLTRDQHGRPALKDAAEKPTELDRRYLTEKQLFLEPGDPRVRDRVRGIAEELAARYPRLAGIHFDYIRYPAAPPYIPGSRFNDVGLSYGYGEANVKKFRDRTGIDPLKVTGRTAQSRVWDDWKREQVTSLIREAAAAARRARPGIKISCAVVAPFDRAYLAASQDWPLWVSEGSVDFVVLMNYSEDARYVALMLRAAMGLVKDPAKVFAGLGAFLMKEDPTLLERQIGQCAALSPGGLVLFDYDSIAAAPALRSLFERPRT